MNFSRTPAEIIEAYAAIGQGKARRAAAPLLLLGILAGAIIAFGSAATSTVTAVVGVPWAARLISALLFPFGLGMVIILGAELFTGNSLMVIPLLEHRCRLPELLRSWALVYAANLAGSLLVAAGCALFGQMDFAGWQVAVAAMQTAVNKCSLPFGNALVSGFFCNVLVCLAVLMALSARDTAGRLMGAYLPICFFVLCGFEHCVANMYYIPAGLLAKTVPAYTQLAAAAGLDLSGLTVSRFLLGNLLPVTLGNILGGVSISLLMWAATRDQRLDDKV